MTTGTATTTTTKAKKTRNTFTMPQRLTTDGDCNVTQAGDFITITADEGDGQHVLKASEYNAVRILRMLAEHLKVALPAGVLDKIKKAEPREPRKQ